MEDMLILLPTLFAYWAGFLIAWSIVVIGGLFVVIHIIKKHRLSIRRSDISAIVVAFIGGMSFITSVFITSEMTTLIVDAMIIAAFWYTLVLGYITGANLSGLPAILYGTRPRNK
jgi:hypothetical protein